jgi:hypothetical protein
VSDVNDVRGDNVADGEADADADWREDTLSKADIDGEGLVVCELLVDALPLADFVSMGEPVDVIDSPDDLLFVLLISADRETEGDFVLLADEEVVVDSFGAVEIVKSGDFVFAGFGLEDGDRVARVELDGVRDVVEDFVRPPVRVSVTGAEADGLDKPDAVSIAARDIVARVDRELDGELVGERDMPPVALSVVEIRGVVVWAALREADEVADADA